MEYKEGDWVQIINVDEIYGHAHFSNGDITQISFVTEDFPIGLIIKSVKKKGHTVAILAEEFDGIQPVEKPIKQSNQEFIEQIEKVNRDIERYNETAKQDYYRMLETDVEITAETESVFNELMVNFALDTGDRELFMQLTKKEMVT